MSMNIGVISIVLLYVATVQTLNFEIISSPHQAGIPNPTSSQYRLRLQDEIPPITRVPKSTTPRFSTTSTITESQTTTIISSTMDTTSTTINYGTSTSTQQSTSVETTSHKTTSGPLSPTEPADITDNHTIIFISLLLLSIVCIICIAYLFWKIRRMERITFSLLDTMMTTATEYAHVKYVLLEHGPPELKSQLISTINHSPVFTSDSDQPEHECCNYAFRCTQRLARILQECYHGRSRSTETTTRYQVPSMFNDESPMSPDLSERDNASVITDPPHPAAVTSGTGITPSRMELTEDFELIPVSYSANTVIIDDKVSQF